MADHLIHDQKLLREEAYVDDSRLDVRYRTHQLYTINPIDFTKWTLERLTWRGDERLLDAGCGPGDLLREMVRHHDGWGALVGLDYSPGMINKAIATAGDLPIHFLVGDAQALPCPSGSFDVVMAGHMLYHVPDIKLAVAEMARVLRPGGRFLATTNSAHTMPEYRTLRERAAARFPTVIQPGIGASRFALENGASFLKPPFDQVETHILPGILRFPAAQPFVDYFASARALTMHPDHSDAEWQAVLDFVRAEIEAVIARQGHFDVTKITGAVMGIKGD